LYCEAFKDTPLTEDMFMQPVLLTTPIYDVQQQVIDHQQMMLDAIYGK
jgi:hypothetical protein